MVRYINCIRRKKGLSDMEFREYWNSPEFDNYIQTVAGAFGAVSVKKNLTLKVPQNDWIAVARGTAEPYDGVIEYWLENSKKFEKSFLSKKFLTVGQEISRFQAQFMDLKNCSSFFTEG